MFFKIQISNSRGCFENMKYGTSTHNSFHNSGYYVTQQRYDGILLVFLFWEYVIQYPIALLDIRTVII